MLTAKGHHRDQHLTLFSSCAQGPTDDKFAIKTVEIDGTPYSFLIDEDGDIRTTKKVYKDSDDVEVLDATVEGFAFDTSAKKVINGSF